MGGRLPVQTVTLLARTAGAPGAAAMALGAAVRETDARLVADVVLPLEQRLLTSLAQPRLYAVLLGAFASCALMIAAVGLYGVLSYSVSQRARELAVRAALGAGRGEIVRLVVRQGLSVTVWGIAAGMVAATWLTRVLSTQLYGVTTHDPLTFVLVPLLLLTVGTLACVIPARSAASLDPLRTLRGG
jgi:putative ABC transport system permease protein